MAVSPVALIRERLRQSITGDDRFFQKLLYYFELRIPLELLGSSMTGQASFLFPLVLGPQSISMEEPFTVSATPTQGGGLYVEENGIVQRMLKIRGHTGFKLRTLKANGPHVLDALTPDKRSFGRFLPGTVLDKISGQRHFQYLQDAVFRTYADLKRDPATSENTQLVFHNPKDEEHWLVVPQRFTMERDSSKPVHYTYAIDLLVVAPAEDADADFSEDQNLLDQIKDTLRMVQSGVSMIAGAINDLTALVGELTNLVKDVGKIIDSATTVLSAASNFVEGVTAFIQSPLALVNSVVDLVDEALALRDTVERSLEDITRLPENVKQKFRQLADGAERIATHPEAFETPVIKKIRETKRRQELLASMSRAALQEAEGSAAPTTLDAAAGLGTAVTPGDVQIARSELGVGRETRQYTGATSITVEQGDTLVSLAAKYLGDARRWQDIAILNGMKPPFINDLADVRLGETEVFPGTLGTGGKILIPNYSRPPNRQPLLPVLGVGLEEPAENHFLGTDFALTEVGGRPGAPRFDWEVDEEGGSVDLKHVSGYANMGQALKFRLSVEKGTDKLYTRLGVERVIGLNIDAVDLETAKFRITQAVLSDPRVASLRRVTFDAAQGDQLASDMVVELRGFSQPTTIRLAGL